MHEILQLCSSLQFNLACLYSTLFNANNSFSCIFKPSQQSQQPPPLHSFKLEMIRAFLHFKNDFENFWLYWKTNYFKKSNNSLKKSLLWKIKIRFFETFNLAILLTIAVLRTKSFEMQLPQFFRPFEWICSKVKKHLKIHL